MSISDRSKFSIPLLYVLATCARPQDCDCSNRFRPDHRFCEDIFNRSSKSNIIRFSKPGCTCSPIPQRTVCVWNNRPPLWNTVDFIGRFRNELKLQQANRVLIRSNYTVRPFNRLSRSLLDIDLSTTSVSISRRQVFWARLLYLCIQSRCLQFYSLRFTISN